MTPVGRARLVSTLALLVPVCAAAVLSEYGRYRVAMAEVTSVRRVLTDTLDKCRVVEKRRADVEAGLEELEADLSRLGQVLPPTLSVDELLADVRGQAAPLGLIVLENDFRSNAEKTPPKAQLSVVLRGGDGELEAFPKELRRCRRLVVYEEADRGPGFRLAVLTAWAAPAEGPLEDRRRSISARVPALPPFSTIAERARADVEALARELARLRSSEKLLRHYERRKERRETMVAVISALKKQIDGRRAGG